MLRQRIKDGQKSPDATEAERLAEENQDRVLLNWLCARLFAVISFLIFIFFFIWPSPISPVEIRLSQPPSFTATLTPNGRLASSRKFYENFIAGPRNLVFHKGALYTGTQNGRIVEIVDGMVRTVAQLGTGECAGRLEQHVHCGRPMGLRFNPEGYLVVADAYLGLWEVNIATGDRFRVLRTSKKVAAHPLIHLNDVEIESSGSILITQSSSHWQLRHLPYLMLEGRKDGRLLRHDRSKNLTSVVLSDLQFPSGIQLSTDQTFILITETLRCRILKHHLKGPKAGQTEIFADDLPGFPVGIRRSAYGGGYWVTFAWTRRADKFSFLDFLAKRPWLRSIVAKVFPLKWLYRMLEREQQHGLVVELSSSGKIIQSLHDPSGLLFREVSQVIELERALWVGSSSQSYLGKLFLGTNRGFGATKTPSIPES